ncbi:UNVERIFIED_CONTAM: hypothetical protein FKN15_027109 [Acipenser sinensis]
MMLSDARTGTVHTAAAMKSLYHRCVVSRWLPGQCSMLTQTRCYHCPQSPFERLIGANGLKENSCTISPEQTHAAHPAVADATGTAAGNP